MKAIPVLITLFFLLAHTAIGQQNTENIPKLTGPYLGQKPPGVVPEIFASGIVSTGDFEHSKLEFAGDGSVMYWAAQPEGNESGSLTQKIWFVKKEKDGWAKPEQLPVAQIGVRSATVYPIGGDIIYIGSNDTTATKSDQLKDGVFRIDKGYTTIEKITDRFPMLTACWSFSFARNGDLYYDHAEGETFYIYWCEYKDGVYSAPRKMNASINDGNFSIHPFISPDESYLIFSSFRSGGRGIADLYISFKNESGDWSEARNMGDVINTDMLERFPTVSPDGKYLFFTRNKGEISDFYWVDARIIDSLRPKE